MGKIYRLARGVHVHIPIRNFLQDIFPFEEELCSKNHIYSYKETKNYDFTYESDLLENSGKILTEILEYEIVGTTRTLARELCA